MAIYIITGKPGSGKTYYLVKKAKEFLKQGRHIFSNFWLNVSPEQVDQVSYFTNIFEIMDAKNGVILIDEAQIYFNARNWETLETSVQYKLQQSRKHGLDIWGTVQHLNRLDTVVRELVNHYYEVRKIIGSNEKDGKYPKRPWGVFRLKEFDPRDANLKRRDVLNWEFFLLRKEVYSFFDTTKSIGLEVETSMKDNIIDLPVFICPFCHHKRLLR